MKKLINFIVIFFSFNIYNSLALAPKNFEFARAIRSNARIDGFHKFQYLSQQTTITEPGIYVIPDDVVFTPRFDGDSYITINSDNVMVDLNLKSITQDPLATQNNVVGITVSAGHSNIILRNGCINGMSGYGIRVQDSAEVLDFHDMVIIYCGIAGVYLDGLSDNTTIANALFLNLTINEVQSNRNQPVYGIYGRYCEILNIDNVGAGNTYSSNSPIYGIKFDNSANIRIKSCVSSDNYSSETSVIGFDFYNCQSVLCLDCAASQNIYTGTETNTLACGFHAKSCQDLFLEGCTSVGNVSTFTAIGFLIENSTNSGALKSDFLGNQSSYATGAGIVSINGLTNVFKECTIGGNSSGVNALGCWILSSTGASVYKCEIDGDLAQTGTSYGILIDNSFGCFVSQNLVAGHVGGTNGFGILDTLATFSVNRFYANVCSLNTNNFDSGLLSVIPMYTGPFSQVMGTFQNASL